MARSLLAIYQYNTVQSATASKPQTIAVAYTRCLELVLHVRLVQVRRDGPSIIQRPPIRKSRRGPSSPRELQWQKPLVLGCCRAARGLACLAPVATSESEKRATESIFPVALGQTRGREQEGARIGRSEGNQGTHARSHLAGRAHEAGEQTPGAIRLHIPSHPVSIAGQSVQLSVKEGSSGRLSSHASLSTSRAGNQLALSLSLSFAA